VVRLSLLVLSERAEFSRRICAQLNATPHAHVSVVVERRERLAEAVAARCPDLVFVDLTPDPDGLLAAIAALPAPRPATLVAGSRADSALILRAMELGAKHYFPEEPPQHELHATLARIASERTPGAPARSLAPIVAVMGAKGGVGASIVACQLAVSLKRQGGRTAVVDLNLPLGDVALYFDLEPRHNLAHVARDADRLDASYLRNALAEHASGVHVLAAPTRLDEAMLVKGDHVDRVLQLLREDFDWIVVDVSREWKETSIRALDLAAHVLLVTLPDVATLSQARKHLELLRRVGRPEESLHLVTNRNQSSAPLGDRDYLSFLGRVPEVRIPNDFATALLSVNEGRPVGDVAPRSALHVAYDALAHQLAAWCGRPPEPDGEGRDDDDAPAAAHRAAARNGRPALREAAPASAPLARRAGWDAGPRPFQVLTIASNKGGVGKTTIATNLAVFLRALREDLPILVLEFDDQTMPDRMFAIEGQPAPLDVAQALRTGSFAEAARLGQYGVHYVPSSAHISDLKREIDDPGYLQEVLLRTGWQGLVIIDTKSDLEILSQNALAASDLSLVIVHDLASLQQAQKVFDLFDAWQLPRERARVLLSLVDRRIKYREGEDVLGLLLSRIRERGYPLVDGFLSRSHSIEALYTNPEGRAHSILHGAKNSLVHRQMRHLAQDVLAALDEARLRPAAAPVLAPAPPRALAAVDPRSAPPRRWREYAADARAWAKSRLGS
jgi:Flp pilus assembly CpaE family ATPase